MFPASCFYESLSSSKQQAQLKLRKIYVEVNRNGADFMEKKYGIDTSAATEPEEKHQLDLAPGAHACTGG